MFRLLFNWAILAGAVILTTVILRPVIRIKRWQTAFVVAAVFGVLNVLLYKLLFFLTLPAVIITFGLFTFVISALLLWVTDQLIDDFEIRGFGWTIIAAALITFFDRCAHYVIS